MSGSYGKAKFNRPSKMKLQPLTDFDEQKLPASCCAKCGFWQREALRDNGGMMIAPCRRFPPSLVVLPVPMDENVLAKLRLDPRTGGSIPPGQMPMIPQAVPMMVPMPAHGWCGEFDPVQTPLKE